MVSDVEFARKVLAELKSVTERWEQASEWSEHREEFRRAVRLRRSNAQAISIAVSFVESRAVYRKGAAADHAEAH